MVHCLPGRLPCGPRPRRASRAVTPSPRAPDADARRRAAASVSRTGRIPLTGVWPAQPQAAPSVRLLAAQIGRLDDLRVAPDGVLLAEVEVVVGDLLEGRVLGRLVPDHLEPRLLEGS